MSNIATTIDKRTVAIQLEVRKLGVRRKVPSSVVRIRDQSEEQTDPAALCVSKQLLACKEYDAIAALDAGFKNRLLRFALPSMLRRGVYLIPIDFVDRVDAEIRAYERARRELVEQLVGVYARAVDEARERLSTLFDPGDYPPEEAVREAFTVRVQYIAIDVPANLRRLNAAVFDREVKKLRESMQVAAEEVRTYLRKGLLDLVEHLGERLSPDPATGKPKILQERTVQNLSEWLSLFDGRNVTNDEELSKIVAQCRQAVSGVDVTMLRKDEQYREKLSTELGRIKDSLSPMIAERPVRKFAWDDAA